MSVEEIFRAYDVRGRVPGDLDADVMRRIGRAFGSDLLERGADAVVVGRDMRPSSEDLLDALADGIAAAGVDVQDAGFVPYGPVLFAGWDRGLPSAYITASHLAAGWNGVKFADGDGGGYLEEENMAVRDRFLAEEFAEDGGTRAEVDVLDAYRGHLLDRVDLDPVDVLLDPGNGSAGVAAPDLFWDAGATLEVMNGDPDGTFPNRPSDVTAETLEDLRAAMRDGEHDVGLAYDGDADRVAVVDDRGRLLSAEQVAYVLLDVLFEEETGPVVANVECSRMLEEVAERHGRDVVRVRVGHSYLFQGMQEHDAVLGVEKSRHMAVRKILPLDDGIAASLAVAEVVSRLDRPLSAVVDDIPDYHRDRISFEVPDAVKFDVVERLQDALEEEYEETNTLDGIRVETEQGWILIRASNTSPKVRLTVEAETQEAFEELEREFSARLDDAIEDATAEN